MAASFAISSSPMPDTQLINRRTAANQARRCRIPGRCPAFLCPTGKDIEGTEKRQLPGSFLHRCLHAERFLPGSQFLKWKNTYMMKMEEWMHIISEMDAMVSMADFRYNHPRRKRRNLFRKGKQEIVVSEKGEEIVFEGKKSSFPRCQGGEERFHHQGRQLLYHHRSQHGGKEYLPAFAGRELYPGNGGYAGVCGSAEDFIAQIVLEARTTDDLTHGISYFNAELIRLEELLKFCRKVLRESAARKVRRQ